MMLVTVSLRYTQNENHMDKLRCHEKCSEPYLREPCINQCGLVSTRVSLWKITTIWQARFRKYKIKMIDKVSHIMSLIHTK